MRNRTLVTLALLAIIPASGAAQGAAKLGIKEGAASRAKSVLGKAADTAATSAASLIADTLLGSSASLAPAGLDANGQPACPAGQMAVPAAYLTPNGTAAPSGAAMVPSPGSALVGMAKSKLGGSDSADAGPAAPASGYVCGTPEQVNAAMQSAQAGAGTPGVKQGLTSMLGSTRKGAMVGGAVAAAPLAGKAARKIGGMFGRGGQSAESMQKDLAKGRLTMKKLHFAEGSDEFGEGGDEEVAKLAQAIAAAEGRFELRLSPEGDEDSDRALAGSRVQRVLAHLLVAGIPADRLSVAVGDRAAKRGDARLELVAARGAETP